MHTSFYLNKLFRVFILNQVLVFVLGGDGVGDDMGSYKENY